MVFIIAALLLLSSFINAGTPESIKEDYFYIREANDTGTTVEHEHKTTGRNVSPPGFVANSLLTIYQTLISSQDSKVCNFRPSCSHFARDAINRAGFIKGSLMAADRLSRCHPYAIGHYKIDIKTGLSIDPVEDYLDR